MISNSADFIGRKSRRVSGPRNSALALLCLASIVLLAAGTTSAIGQVSEYAVKAAFVYKFSEFVEWPAGSFKSSNAPITICVLGENPFGNALEQITEGKFFAGRGFQVMHISSANTAKGCRVLFISRSEKKRLGPILSDLAQPGILTVGDTAGYAERGVMINLYLEGDKVRFEINPDAAARAGIKISSKLLSLAKITSSGS
ncbi:MAG: YfiR family protein [Terriglobia bacterium]